MTLTPGMHAALAAVELTAALNSPQRAQLLIGVAYHPERDALLATFADGLIWWITAGEFAEPSGDGCVADLAQLAIIDFGQTLRCGESFEAAADWMRSVGRPTHLHRPTC